MTNSSEDSSIVLYGGTFDPPHKGHVHCISVVLDSFLPTRIEMIPSDVPPVSKGTLKKGVSSFSHRYKMCELLLKDFGLEGSVHINSVESKIDGCKLHI